MPTPDFPPYRRRRNVGLRSLTSGFAYLAFTEAMKRKRRKPGKELDEGGVPVEPDRPRNLEGGAAAELDFEDE
jgi:hypothetical protein